MPKKRRISKNEGTKIRPRPVDIIPCDRHRYNLPTAASNEIAVILPGSEDQPQGDRDIILQRKDGSLIQIEQRHPGQLGWHPRIEYNAGEMVPDADELDSNAGENNEGFKLQKRESISLKQNTLPTTSILALKNQTTFLELESFFRSILLMHGLSVNRLACFTSRLTKRAMSRDISRCG